MSGGRSWFKDTEHTSPGLVRGVFGFVTTNIGTNPDVTLAYGLGGLTGADAAGSVPNGGPTFVASITKTANNGEFLVTLQDGYRAVWYANATLFSTGAGPNDGKRAGVCAPLNEGSGRTTAITFLVTTIDTSGNPVETSGRRCHVEVVLKASGSGA